MRQHSPFLTVDEAGMICGAGILAWLPLYLADGYVHLIDHKTNFFYMSSALSVVLLLTALLARRPDTERPGILNAGRPGVPPARDVSLMALGGLCAVYLLNLITAADRSTAFWGLEGRHNGTMMVLVCTVCYCILHCFVRRAQAQTLFSVFLAAACTVGLLGWLNYFLIDPLNLYYILDHDTARIFLSTIGNVNFFGALMAMGAALAAGLCLRAQRAKAALLYGFATTVLAVSLIPANSDAAWLGLFGALAVLVCMRGLLWKQLARLFFAGAGFFALALPFGLGARSLPVRDELGSLSALFSHPAAAGVCLSVFLAFGMLLRKRGRPCMHALRACVAILLALLFVLLLLANLTPVPLGPLENILRFSQTWGSGRGYVWGRLLYVYHDELTVLQKLIGAGGDSVDALLNPHYTDYIIAINGQTYDSAHNVYVQQLLCGGALGLLFWLIFWWTRIRAGLRSESPAAPALAAYCIQAFFSIDMPAVLPAAFALAALAAPQPDLPSTPPPRRMAVLVGALGLFLLGAAISPMLL